MNDAASQPKHPFDLNRLTVIVAAVTGDAPTDGEPDNRPPAAVALGRKGGAKGGRARAAVPRAERRREIARKVTAIWWTKAEPTTEP